MNEEEVYKNTREHLKIILWVNVAFLVFTIIELSISGAKTFPYMSIFFVLEILMFILFYMPSFIYHIIKGRSLKYSSSKALLSFGDTLSFFGSW